MKAIEKLPIRYKIQICFESIAMKLGIYWIQLRRQGILKKTGYYPSWTWGRKLPPCHNRRARREIDEPRVESANGFPHSLLESVIQPASSGMPCMPKSFYSNSVPTSNPWQIYVFNQGQLPGHVTHAVTQSPVEEPGIWFNALLLLSWNS